MATVDTNQFKAFQADVRSLRDEVKLKLHLAGMDLKDEWKKLEPQLDRMASSAAIVTGEMLDDMRRRLTEFRLRLGKN
ncbi:MAG: hypothetical protein ACOZQL_23110 [Myxococcota bacterium]